MASVLLPCPICGHNYREAQGCCQKSPPRAPYKHKGPSSPVAPENAPENAPQEVQRHPAPEVARLYRAVREIGGECFIVNEGGEYRVIRNLDGYSEYDLAKRLVLTCNWSTTIEDVKEAI